MAPRMLAMCVVLLLLMAAAADCQARWPDHAVNATVSIQSEMGAGTALGVHCVEQWHGRGIPLRDLGQHQLANNERFSFVVAQPNVDKQVYVCYFTAAEHPETLVPVYFGAYFRHSDCACEQGPNEAHCPVWTVNPKGFFCGSILAFRWGGAR